MPINVASVVGEIKFCVTPAHEPTQKNCKMNRSLNQNPFLELTCFIGCCHVGVWKRLSHDQPCSLLFVFTDIGLWLITSLVDPTVRVFIVGGPLQFLVSTNPKAKKRELIFPNMALDNGFQIKWFVYQRLFSLV